MIRLLQHYISRLKIDSTLNTNGLTTQRSPAPTRYRKHIVRGSVACLPDIEDCEETMTASYQKHGIQFLYPENWILEEQDGDHQETVSVQSPNTAFWSITIDYNGTSPDSLLTNTLSVLQEEYSTLDTTPVEENIGDRKAVGQNIAFFCMDLTNTAHIRVFQVGQVTLLILYQASDLEWPTTAAVFEAITLSLHCDPSHLQDIIYQGDDSPYP